MFVLIENDIEVTIVNKMKSLVNKKARKKYNGIKYLLNIYKI